MGKKNKQKSEKKDKHIQTTQSTDIKEIDSMKNKQDIEALKNEIARDKDELQKKQSELEQKKADKQGKIDSFGEKYEMEEDKLAKLIREELEQAAGKKNKEKNHQEAAVAEKQQKELNVIQNTTFKSKLEGDISRIKKDIELMKSKIKQKDKDKNNPIHDSKYKSELSELISTKPNQSGKGKKITLQVPSLSCLPETGRLYKAGGQDYLAIQNWEEFETGQNEAARFKAKLCVERS